ncbi:MAG: DUF3429 domain-containing protein [Pseudomonadales bacterium]
MQRDDSIAEDWLTTRLASSLGYAGAAFIPLLFAVAVIDADFLPVARRLTAIYGAVILAFLGGIQWGLALKSRIPRIRLRRLVASVMPSLWSVAALTTSINLSCLVLSVGFAGLLVYEYLERGDDVYPLWYLPLRLRLTAFITVGLAGSLLV